MSLLDIVKEHLEGTRHIVQMVKHLDEVPPVRYKYPLWGQVKYDGVYCLLVVSNGDHCLFSRTGKVTYFESELSHIGRYLSSLADGVYISELCNDSISLETLAGLTSPNRKAAWTEEEHTLMSNTYMMYHDYITIQELLDGVSEVSYKERYETLRGLAKSAGVEHLVVENSEIFNPEEAQKFADDLIQNGEEGAVFKPTNAHWVAGHKGHHAMKIVRGVNMDLRCIGVEYGKGKREGQIAKLVFKFHDNEFSADLGRGWTDTRRQTLTTAYEEYREGYTCSVTDTLTGEVFKNPVGLIWEVKALQISSTGKALRLPKVVRVREDKDTPDDELQSVFGSEQVTDNQDKVLKSGYSERKKAGLRDNDLRVSDKSISE